MRDTLAGREAASYDELEEAEVQEISSLMRQARCHCPACPVKPEIMSSFAPCTGQRRTCSNRR